MIVASGVFHAAGGAAVSRMAAERAAVDQAAAGGVADRLFWTTGEAAAGLLAGVCKCFPLLVIIYKEWGELW